MSENRERIQLIDALRGVSILLMVLHHFGYDLVAFMGVPAYLIYNPLVETLQLIFASLFIFLSGASCIFSRNNLKRGVEILLCGIAVTIVTYLFDKDAFVVFGILHFLGCAAIIYALIRPALDKVKIHPVIWVILFIVSKIALSRAYDIPHLWALGIYTDDFVSSDYFPIFPWIFMYLFGTWFGHIVVEKKLPEWFYSFKCDFFAAVGRRTLIIYLLHQPVIMGIIYLLKLIPAFS